MTAERERLRVAFFGHAQGRRGDGLSTYSAELVSALVHAGVEVRFFAHEEDGDELPVPAAVAVRLRAWHFKTVTIPRPGAMRTISAALWRFRPDVVHISWSFSLADGAIARTAHELGAACVATFHLPHGPAGSARARVLDGLYRYHRLHMGAVDRCIVLSAAQADLLAQAGYPRARIDVIPNAVDTIAFSPGPSAWRAGVDAETVTLYMGRLDPEKRVPALVRAFLDLGLGDRHVLCIAGDGVQRERIARLAGGHRTIRLLGLVSGARRLDVYRGCDVFVLPSTAEGLALSLLEAMACGRAILATDAGEDGRALGDAGLVIPTHPLRPALEQGLRSLLADGELRATLGAAARARAESQFAMTANTERVLAVYAAARGQNAESASSAASLALP